MRHAAARLIPPTAVIHFFTLTWAVTYESTERFTEGYFNTLSATDDLPRVEINSFTVTWILDHAHPV
jgi:hypothetical protein